MFIIFSLSVLHKQIQPGECKNVQFKSDFAENHFVAGKPSANQNDPTFFTDEKNRITNYMILFLQ